MSVGNLSYHDVFTSTHLLYTVKCARAQHESEWVSVSGVKLSPLT